MRRFERWVRQRRVDLSKRIGATKRGKKLVLDFLPKSIKEVTVDCGDHTLVVTPHELIGRHVITKGDFDRSSVLGLLKELNTRNLLQADGCLLEIGANIGTHTIYFALTRRFRRIVAIEPDPHNFRLLSRNIEINQLGGVVTPFEVAAGAADGELALHRVEQNHGNASFLHPKTTGGSVVVKVKPVGDIIHMADVRVDDISLIWMDIEGYEPYALQGMTEILKRGIPLFMEFSPAFYQDRQAEFVEFLRTFYGGCVIFSNGKPSSEAPIADLLHVRKQCDVLLINR